MKKAFLLLLVVFTSISFGQRKKIDREKFTPEQRIELRVKKLTLKLDLNKEQENQIKALLKEENSSKELKRTNLKLKRQNKQKITTDELFHLKMQKIEYQIERKSKFKKILNIEQMKEFEKMKKNHKKHDSLHRKH